MRARPRWVSPVSATILISCGGFAVRPTLGVIVAFVAMMALVLGLSLGLWFAMGVDAVLLPGRFDGTIGLNTWAVLAAVVGGLFAGWLCATISRSALPSSCLRALLPQWCSQRSCTLVETRTRHARGWVDDNAGNREEERAFMVHAADPGCGFLQCIGRRVAHAGGSKKRLREVAFHNIW